VEYPKDSFALKMHKHGILTGLLLDVVSEYLQTGILQMLYDKGHERLTTFSDNPPDPEPVFTLKDLEYGFVLYLGACGICIVVFICEKMKVKRCLWVFIENCLGLVLFLLEMKKIMKGYH
jgi:hypothetical protein